MAEPARPDDAHSPQEGAAPEPHGYRPPAGAPPSFGNVGEHHWSRARAGTNREALDYYRERSRAPGVAQGGESRNFYCMRCDGVIPHAHAGTRCPHCEAPLEGVARRYFNWVEIDQPPASDAGPLVRLAGFAVLGLILLALLSWWILSTS